MKIVSKTPDSWRAAIGAISSINDEALFEIKETGITLKCFEISKVAFIVLEWAKEQFESFIVEKSTKVGIRVEDLKKALDRSTPKDTITLELIKDGSQLQISIGDKKKYQLKLISPELVEKEKPIIKHDVEFDIETAHLNSLLQDIKVVDEYITLEGTDRGVQVSGKGDSGTSSSVINGDKVKKAKSRYSISFIESLLKGVGSTVKNIHVGFSENAPLQLSLNIQDMNSIEYYLAPKQPDSE